MRCVLPMFKDGGWEYDGPYFKFPLRQVLPKPIQKPHPPLWVACSQLETIEMAGRRGIGALGFQFLSAEMAQAWVHAYYNSFTKRLEKLADYQTNRNIAMVSYFMCAETDEEARRRADGVTFFQFSLAYYSGAKGRERAKPGSVSLWDEYNKWKAANPEAVRKALSGGLIGSPETIRRKLRRFEASHVDQIILLNQAGNNTHEHICESLELFAKEVMPEFHAKEPEHQALEAAGPEPARSNSRKSTPRRTRTAAASARASRSPSSPPGQRRPSSPHPARLPAGRASKRHG